jgi:hypothetical protein
MRALHASSCLLQMPVLLAVAAMGMAMCGCSGSKPKTVPVAGQVYVGDRPAAHAIVTFHPVGAGADAVKPVGHVDEQGHFRLTTFKEGDGAPPGEYKVTIAAYQSIEQKHGDDLIVNLLPDKYAKPETSNLTATVKKGSNEIEPFKLEPR